jgi:hypothetical protein
VKLFRLDAAAKTRNFRFLSGDSLTRIRCVLGLIAITAARG